MELNQLNQQFEVANQRARELRASLPRAVSAHFDRRTHRIVIQLSSRVELSFSPREAEGLENARPVDLEPIMISPSGFGIHFPRLDADLYLPALLAGVLGSKRWMARNREPAERDKELQQKPEPQKGPVTFMAQPGNAGSFDRMAQPDAMKPRRGLTLVPGRLSAPRAPERAHPEIEKQHNDPGRDQEHPVVGPVSPTGPHTPKGWTKYDYGQKEEYTGNFKPQNAADAAKGAQKTSHASRDTSAGPHRVLLDRPSGRLCLIDSARYRLGGGLSPRLDLLPGRGVGRACQPLAGYAPRNPQSGTQHASNDLWSHTVYDGSSDAG